MTRSRRAQLHLRMAQALEALDGRRPGPHLARIVHHYLRLGDAAEPGRLADAAVRAAEWAMTRLAFEDALELYGHALDVLPADDDRRPTLRARRLVAGQALYHQALDAPVRP